MKPLATVLAFLLAVPASAIQVEKLRTIKPLSLGGGVSEIEVAAGEALVRFPSGLTRGEREAALVARGVVFISEVGETGWTRVQLPGLMSVEPGLLLLRSIPGVLDAEPNHVYRPTRIPNDLLFPQQYHLGKINASAAWEYEVGASSRVTVAVIDAGMEGTHPDLQAKIIAGSRDCTSGVCVANDPPTKACNHGTRVGGVAAAITGNGSQVAGVSWEAKLLSIKVFPNSGCNDNCTDVSLGNQCATTDAILAVAIDYVRSLANTPVAGRIVANWSLGECNATCNPGVLQTAITNAFNAGVVNIVAAGNIQGGCTSAINKPANCADVIPVGSTDANDNISSFSCQGPELAANGLVAPGNNLTTTDLNGGITGAATGTSFAAPVVSGLAALILAAKPTFTPTQVKNTLRGSTDGIGVSALSSNSITPLGNSAGAGRANAFKAMKLAVEGTLAGFEGEQKVIAFPNPFRTSETGTVTITIPVSLQSRGTSIRVYTIDGQLVRDLRAQTTWDGKNDGGNQVASGTYLILVKTEAGTQTGKLAVIR